MIRILVILISMSGILRALPPTYIITEGDSMTAGFGLESGQDWPHLMDIPSATINNVSRSGSKIEDCFPTNRVYNPMIANGTARQVAVLWIGYNDIKVPRSLSAITDDITLWLSQIKAQRPSAKYVISTVVDGGSFGSPAGSLTAKRILLGQLNTWIRANSLGFDAVVDIAATEQAADWTDTTWRMVDGTHFNLAATQVFANMFQSAILAIYDPPAPDGPSITTPSFTTGSLSITP